MAQLGLTRLHPGDEPAAGKPRRLAQAGDCRRIRPVRRIEHGPGLTKRALHAQGRGQDDGRSVRARLVRNVGRGQPDGVGLPQGSQPAAVDDESIGHDFHAARLDPAGVADESAAVCGDGHGRDAVR
jgi:hypothetical protein